MSTNILYILPSFNKFGGTPKKTMDLIKYSPNTCYLYVWTNAYSKEFKSDFVEAGAHIVEGAFNRNIVKHIKSLLKVIDENDIKIIQSQFFFGELLAGILKLLRPKLKLIIAFVGAMSPSGYRKQILNLVYKKADAFVYISKYVKQEKTKAFPKLKKANGIVIYNGTNKPVSTNKSLVKEEKGINILCVSGLSKIKNVQVLIDCAVILLEKKYNQIKFLVAGDGPEKESFENQVKENNLSKNFKLLGYQKDIGDLYRITDFFVHPCYIEGFGIAVAEAMVEEKPIIVANAGAMPELILHEETGLIVDSFDANQWANAIIRYIENPELSKTLARNAKTFAETEFSVKRFVEDYNNLYKTLLS
mgnify:CR=1 FL=1